MTQLDLDSYFERIGYQGPRTATLDTLRALHALHPAAIPFENLTPFAGMPVALDPVALQQKLISKRRGGYCFEHNLLFLDVLRGLGFQASGLAARVLWNQPEDAITPRGHMLLRVELEGTSYIADVGFGGQTLTAPLKLETEAPQDTPHERFRLKAGADSFALQSEVRGGYRTLYRFDLAPTYLADYEVSNYYLSTHPRSHFRTGLMVARALPGRRYALRNRSLSVHTLGGESEHRDLESPAALREVLEQLFGIRVPEWKELDQALARLFAP